MTAAQENLRSWHPKSGFQWDDPLLLEDMLDDEERLVRDSSKAFADAELRPRVTDAYLNETPAPELFPRMGSTGLFGMTLPEKHGGSDASYVSYGLAAREIERVDSGYRSMISVQ